jgi:hypothetical protein
MECRVLRRCDDLQSIISLPSTLIDGYLVLSAVLARKLDVLLLPRQVLLAGHPGRRVGAISFVHGVPQASTVAGVTHAQDKRLRRMLLNQAGLPTPPGITFSSKGSAHLQRFLNRHAYPFVLKEAIGENPSLKLEIFNATELNKAISRLRVLSHDHLAPARSLVTSGYAENMLNADQDDGGIRIAPPHARLLIEKRVEGRHIRSLVCANRILAAVEINNAQPKPRTEILNQLHADFKEVIIGAASVIPCLFVA